MLLSKQSSDLRFSSLEHEKNFQENRFSLPSGEECVFSFDNEDEKNKTETIMAKYTQSYMRIREDPQYASQMFYKSASDLMLLNSVELDPF